MVKDYSGSCRIKKGRIKKRVSAKKNSKPGDLFSLTMLMWKTLGAMLFVTLAIGITSTVWYGWQVQEALDQIGKSRIAKNELINANKLLIAQRDLMLKPEHMERSAGKLGLYSPTERQLRYP